MQNGSFEIKDSEYKISVKDDRPVVLSIAAWDSSCSAGLAADIKTFEQFKVKGMGVMTAITSQTENAFYHFYGLPKQHIIHQLIPILENYHPMWIKIGMCDHTLISCIIDEIRKICPGAFILWDPIHATSSGFIVPKAPNNDYPLILRKVQMITPNLPEADWLENELNVSLPEISKWTRVLLKGGHNDHQKGMDVLYENGKEIKRYQTSGISAFEKRGTGCVFSSAVISLLAKEFSLDDSVSGAKKYILKILNSNAGKWAYHAA